MQGFQLVESAETAALLVGGDVVQSSARKVYLCVTVASATILSGSVVRTFRGGSVRVLRTRDFVDAL